MRNLLKIYQALKDTPREKLKIALKFFSSGMDAAGYIRSDVSVEPKLAIKSVHGCTLLMSLFFLQILHAVEGDGGNDDKSLKHKLQVGIYAEEG